MAELVPDRRTVLAAAAGLTMPHGATRAGPADAPPPRSHLSPLDFGARGDGVADDAPAVQRAIDACLGTSPPRPLKVDAQFRLGRTVMIDRPVDTSGPRLHIAGMGGGFSVLGDLAMFATRLARDHNPRSEGVVFRDVVFSADTPLRKAVSFGHGLLRMSFDGCEWYRIRCLETPGYAQSWHFANCRAFDWHGAFVAASGAYDLVAQFQAKFGDTMFSLTSPTFPTMRVRLHDGVYEGLRGAVIRCGKALALLIDGNYIEFNAVPAIDLTARPEGNVTVSVVGNTFMQSVEALRDPNFFDVRWGSTLSGVATGNYCNGRLHDTVGVTDPATMLTITGDVADRALYRGAGQGSAAVGNVAVSGASGTGSGAGGHRVLLDPRLGGVTVDRDGIPRRLVFGAANPQTGNGDYGDVSWGAGSRVFNEAPAPGQPKGWICVAGGRPGRWVAEDPL